MYWCFKTVEIPSKIELSTKLLPNFILLATPNKTIEKVQALILLKVIESKLVFKTSIITIRTIG